MGHKPLAKTSVEVDDGLGALDVAKARSPDLKELVGGLWEQAANVDVGLTTLVLQRTIERLERRRWCRNSTRDGWFAVDEKLDAWGDVALLRLLGNWHAVWAHHGRWRWSAVGEDTAGRPIDGNTTVRIAWVSCVRWRGWLVVLVGRDGVTTRSDECGHFTVSTRSGGSPVLGHWRVVVLLVSCVAHLLHVLRAVWSVHAGRLRSCTSTVVAWKDVLAAAVHRAH